MVREAFEAAIAEHADVGSKLHDVTLRNIESLVSDEKSVILVPVPHHGAQIIGHIRNGCRCFVTIDSPLADLIDAIRSASNGIRYWSDAIVDTASGCLQNSRKHHGPSNMSDCPLTGRELEVLELAAKGMQNKQIARHLKLSIYTVKNHIHRILEKMAAKNRWMAVRFSRDQGWIE